MKKLCFFLLLTGFNICYSETYISTFNYTDSTYTFNKGIYYVPMGSPKIIHWATHSLNIQMNINGAGDGISSEETYSEISEALQEWGNVRTSNFTSELSKTYKKWGSDNLNVIYWCEEGDPAFEEGGPFDQTRMLEG